MNFFLATMPLCYHPFQRLGRCATRGRSMRRHFWVLAAVILLASGCNTRSEEATARGNLLRNEGDLPGAIAAYEEAARESANRADLRIRLAEAYLDVGRWPDAREALRQALALDPESAQARLTLARVEVAAGNPAAAKVQLDRVLARNPDNLYARMSRGNLALDSNDAEAAVRDYAHAIAIDPKNPTALYGYGSALLAAKDRAGAKVAFEALDPDAPFGAYGLARLAATSDTPRSALPLLKETLRRASSRGIAISASDLLGDRHLRALTELPEFTALLATLPAKHEGSVPVPGSTSAALPEATP